MVRDVSADVPSGRAGRRRSAGLRRVVYHCGRRGQAQEEKIVRSSPKYEPRFKIVEWIERLREYLREGSEEDGLETDYFTVTKVDQESTTESKTKPLSIWQGLFPLLWDGQADGREGRLAI